MKLTQNTFLVLTAILFFTAADPQAAIGQVVSTSRTYASGLEGPRGLRFGPDGYLYVAEAGTGGSTSTAGTCDQVPAPVGPYTGGKTSRISRIDANGVRTTVASGFPSAADSIGDVMGVADLAFLDGKLYALSAGGGCSHGSPDVPSGVARVDLSNGKWEVIADIGSFLKKHPARYPSAGDFEPDGALYSLIASDGALLAVEANHGQILSVSKRGNIKEVIDISASQGHIVPTSITERNGSLYVGNLGLFPITPQWERVLLLSKHYDAPDWDDWDKPGFGKDRRGFHVVDSKAGFTALVALDFGPDGLLYALELSSQAGNPAPGTGKVVRLKRSGDVEDVVTGLIVPTGMTFGPDGRLYISNGGAAPGNSGEILQVEIQPGW